MLTPAQKRRIFRELDLRDPGFIEKIEPFLEGLWKHYFRCEVDGWENITDEKALFVSNHNGLITFEVLMLFYAWYKRYGLARRALGLAHGIAVENVFFRWLCPKIGAIPADPEVADEAMARGYSLLVYPGGLKEAFRPHSDGKQVNFFQRKGFIKLALRNNVPIVPIISVGAHETYIIINRGEELAKKLGIYDRLRISGVPITYRSLFFAWCVASGVFTFFPLLLAPAAFLSIFVPLPAKMKFKILPAINVCDMVDENISEEENLQKIYDHVLQVMQKASDEEYSKRRFPIIG